MRVTISTPRPVVLRFAGLVAAAASIALSACGSASDRSASGSPPTTNVPSTSAAPTTAAPTDPIEIVRTVEDFAYYGACGNETVDVGRTTYYPVLPRHRDEIEESRYPVSGEQPEPSGFARVVPPGPGDDVGTMVLFSDGMARFQSDSGRVIWLTDEEQKYNWVC